MLKSRFRTISSTSAFSLVEVLVALAIMTVLAGILIPGLNGKLRDSRTSSVAQTISGLNSGMAEFKKAVGRYPGTLTQLTANPTVSNRDICGTLMTQSSTVLWRGPYLSRDFVGAGMPVGDGLIDADVRRFPTSVTSSPPIIAYALIDIQNIETATAADLDLQLDGVADNVNGAIRYTSSSIAAQVAPANPTGAIAATTASQVTLTFAIPISPYGC